MIISGSAQNSPERVEIQMWVRHAGYANAAPSARNLNLRGMWASLDFDSTPEDPRKVPIGQSCVIGYANALALGYLDTVLGIVSSNMVVGVDCAPNNYRVDRWVNIQTYGHCDRIIVTIGGGDWRYIYPAGGTEDGANWGLTAAEAQAPKQLAGIFTFDGPPANGETINLSGVTTAAGSWNAAPTVVDPSIPGVDVTSASRIIGWYYDGGNETTIEEGSLTDVVYNGIFRKRQGFLCCMGLSVR